VCHSRIQAVRDLTVQGGGYICHESFHAVLSCHVMSYSSAVAELVAFLYHHDYRQLYVTKNYSCRRYRVRQMFSRLRNSSAFKRASKWSKERLDEPWSPEVERYFVGDWKSRSNAVLKDSGLFVLEIAVIYGKQLVALLSGTTFIDLPFYRTLYKSEFELTVEAQK
jgi:hypothetical protein